MFGKLRLLGLVALGVMALANWLLLRHIGELRERLGMTSRDLEAAVAANRNNVDRIDELLAKNNACVEERRVDEAANAAVVAALNRDLDEIRARPRIVREEIYRDPSCAELGAIDIAAVCPAIADGMRELSRRVDGSRGP